jgi:signal transduction histidine kinase
MNTVDFELEKTNLLLLINKSIEIVENKAREKNINISLDVSSKINVLANEDSIKTVVRNLLSNAIKFSHKNSKIKISAKNSTNENYVEVSVIDEGIGMPKDLVSKLFKIETSFSTYGTEKEKGTALGLILCKELIKKNQGEIWIESKENKGTSLSFTLQKSI